MNPSVEEVTASIVKRAAKFQTDYGFPPFDVCLGPEEFEVLRTHAQLPDSDKSSKWRYEAAKYFCMGMRVRLMNTPGILVGTLTSKEA